MPAERAFGFEHLTRALERTIVTALTLQEVALPDELARVCGSFKGRPAVLETRAYRSARVRHARFATMTAGELDIGNLLVLPAFDSELPVLGADFVSLHGDAAMVALDVSPMTQDEALRGRHLRDMAVLHARYVDGLPSGGELPAWCREHFSPFALHSRFSTALAGTVAEAVGAYVQAFLRLFSMPTSNADSRGSGADVSASAQSRYLAAHREDDRGLRMMDKVFGQPWTRRYVDEVLFPEDGVVG